MTDSRLSVISLKFSSSIYKILAVGLLAVFGISAHGQGVEHRDTIRGTVLISYPTNEATIYTDYDNNRTELARLSEVFDRVQADSLVRLLNVTIHGYGSPDGPYELNEQLARQRTDSLAAYVERHWLPASSLSVNTLYTAEDWDGLETLIVAATPSELPHRDNLLKIIHGPRNADDKLWLIKSGWPDDYRFLVENYMPQLRRADYTIEYEIAYRQQVVPQPPVDVAVPVVADSTAFAPLSDDLAGSSRYWVLALRTNLLLPLMNVGVVVPIGNRWSVGADWYYPWIPRRSNKAYDGSDHKDCFQIDGLSLEGRYWLGSRHTADEANRPYRLLGHSVGLFAMGGRYDLERNYSGHQGEYILGGVDYLYAMPIFRGKMHLELSLGVGYFYSRATHYKVFEKGGRGYRDRDIRKIFEYVGPLKANVSLVVPLKLKK